MGRQFGTAGLKKIREKKGALIAGHRGNYGGNIIQNTILSCQAALQLGADIVEIDVTKSRDGVFYVFHTGAEGYVFGKKCDLTAMSSRQIERLRPINGVGERSAQKVERLEDLLAALKGRCYINIDRAWKEDWAGAIELIDRFDMADQIILKSPAEEPLLEALQRARSPLMYMPILYEPKEWDAVRNYKIHTVAAELVFANADDPVADPAFIRKLHREGMLAWVNTLTLVDEASISGWMDDNGAIRDGYDSNWGALLDRGFDVLQTDWPSLVGDYLKKRKAHHKV